MTLGCGLLWVVPAAEGGLPQVVRTDAGPNPADIQDTVDQFRADLGGVNNGVGGSFTSGRREINFDSVPDANAAPNPLNPKFFNTTSPRGAVFNTVEYHGSGFSNEFMVSADANGPTSTPIEFGNIDSSYPATFKPFSSARLFTARRTNVMEVTFFVPGTQIPATVSGFGAVFTDVDVTSGPRVAKITVYDADGDPLGAFTAPASSGGLSFAGVTYTGRDRIARVTIQTGNAALSAGVTDSAATDVIAMDDFIYGEPRAMEEHPGDFDGDGGTDLTVFRPSDGLWFIQNSGSGATHIEAWGINGDIPVADDYDADGKIDIAVFRPSNGIWFIKRTQDGPLIQAFGTSGDIPTAGDYDKDGKTDIAVFRPASGLRFILRSSDGGVHTVAWGTNGDIPVPS